MKSQLSKQLEYLRKTLPQSTPHEKKLSDSFLFSAKKALELRSDEIRVISLSGLNELINIDSRFNNFKETLFSESSLTFKRELQNKTINEKLNISISLFLRILAPYFLLKSAQKTIEYLVRQYQVHYYNIDALMELILPYHSTILFPGLLRIMRIEGTKWTFLESVKTTQVSVSRDSLVLQCIKDFEIVEFIMKYTQEYITDRITHKVLLNFFTAIMIEYITKKKINDLTLKKILPILFFGMENANVNFRISCIMVMTQVSAKVQFQDVLVHRIVDIIVKSMNVFNAKNELIFLIYLCQSQKVKFFSEENFTKIVSVKRFFNVFGGLSKKYNVDNFMYAFTKVLLDVSMRKENIELLMKTFSDLSDVVSPHVSKMSHELFLYHKKKKNDNFVKKVLKIIEKRFPLELDKGIDYTMNVLNDSSILEFVEMTFQGSKFQIINEYNKTLFFILEHPDEHVRALGIQKLEKILEESYSNDLKDFAVDVLYRHLSDDSFLVLKNVVSFSNLLKIVDIKVFIPKLLNVFQRIKGLKDKRVGKIIKKVAKLLVSNEVLCGNNSQQYTVQIIPFILEFLYTEKILKKTNRLIVSSLKDVKHPLFKNSSQLIESISDNSDLNERNNKIIKFLSNNLLSSISNNQLELLHVIAKNNTAQKLILFVLNYSLSVCKDNLNKLKIISVLFDISKTLINENLNVLNVCDVTEINGSFVNNRKISVESLASYTIFNIIKNIVVNEEDNMNHLNYEYTKDKGYNYIKEIFLLLSTQSYYEKLFIPHVNEVLNLFGERALKFITLFLVTDETKVTSVTKLKCLEICDNFIQQDEENKTDYQSVIPVLFVPFTSGDLSVRIATLKVLAVINEKMKTIEEKKEDITKYVMFVSNEDDLVFLKGKIIIKMLNVFTNNDASKNVQKIFKSFSIIKEKEMIVSFLLSHFKYLNSFSRYVIINAMRLLNSETKLKYCFPHIKYCVTMINKKEKLDKFEIDLFQEVLLCLKQSKSIAKEVFEVVLSVLKISKRVESSNFVPSGYLIENIVTNEVFSLFNDEQKEGYITSLVCDNFLQKNTDRTVVFACINSFKHLEIPFDIINNLLRNLFVKNLQYFSDFLELISVMKFIQEHFLIVPELNRILETFVTQNVNKGDPKIYTINMILTIFNSLLKNIGIDNKNVKFDVKLLIKCLKLIDNLEVRMNCIMIIGELSDKVAKEIILLHISDLMNAVEQSIRTHNEHTYDIIEKLVQRIVPHFINDHKNLVIIVESFLNVFEFILPHKRIIIFSILVKEISRKKLHCIIILMLSKKLTKEIIFFSHELIRMFQVPKQIRCLLEIVQFCRDLFSKQIDNTKGFYYLNVNEGERNEIFISVLLEFVLTHFDNLKFLKSLVAYERVKNNTKISQNLLMATFYYTIIFSTEIKHQLKLKKETIKKDEDKVMQEEEEEGEEEEEEEEEDVLSRLIRQLESIQSKFFSVLNGDVYIDLTCELLKHKVFSIKKEALNLLNNRLSDYTSETTKMLNLHHVSYLRLINTKDNIIRLLKNTNENVIIKQSCVITIELLSRRFSYVKQDLFIKMISIVMTNIFGKKEEDQRLILSSFLCLATLVYEIGLPSIRFLPSIFSKLFPQMEKTFSSQVESDYLKEITLLSALRLIILNNTKFMSPYLNKIMRVLLFVCSKDTSNVSGVKVKDLALDIFSFLIKNTPFRLVISPLFNSYSSAVAYGSNSLRSLIRFVGIIIYRNSTRSIVPLKDEILKFFIQSFNMRMLYSLNLKDINEIESEFVSAFVKFVLKLNETEFKEIFKHVNEWFGKDIDVEKNKILKRITYFTILKALFDGLQVLFSKFFTTEMLKDCSLVLSDLIVFKLDPSSTSKIEKEGEEEEEEGEEMKGKASRKRKFSEITPEEENLDESNEISKLKSTLCIKVLNVLEKVFAFDEAEEMKKPSNFDIVMLPLTAQINNFDLGGLDLYEKRMNEGVFPCLCKFVSAVDQDKWKDLQENILIILSRTSNMMIKRYCIKALKCFYETGREDFVIYISEMIPYLAEIKEIDDEELINELDSFVTFLEDSSSDSEDRINIRKYIF